MDVADDQEISVENIFEIINEIGKNVKAVKEPESVIPITKRDFLKQAQDLNCIENSYLNESNFSQKNYTNTNELVKEVENPKNNLKQQRDEKTSKINQLIKEFEELTQQLTNHKLNQLNEFQMLSKKLEIYSSLFKIVWNLDMPENIIKGHIIAEDGVRTFNFDRRQSSLFSICDDIWKTLSNDS